MPKYFVAGHSHPDYGMSWFVDGKTMAQCSASRSGWDACCQFICASSTDCGGFQSSLLTSDGTGVCFLLPVEGKCAGLGAQVKSAFSISGGHPTYGGTYDAMLAHSSFCGSATTSAIDSSTFNSTSCFDDVAGTGTYKAFLKDIDGCSGVDCGTGATCGDVVAPGTGYTCGCSSGYEGATTTDGPATCTGSLNWNIALATAPAVSSTFDGNTEEIAISFTKTTGRAHQVRVFYHDDCSTPITGNSVATFAGNSAAAGDVDGTDEDFTVTIDIDTAIIQADSGTWSQTGNDAEVKFCVLAELLEGSDSVSFLEVQITLRIDMALGFEAAAVDTDRTGAGTLSAEATNDFTLSACHCDAQAAQATQRCGTDIPAGSATLSQNSILDICITTDADDVEIVEIQSLTLTQVGGITRNPVTSSSADALTLLGSHGSHVSFVRTRLVAGFFGDPTPESVVASGTALIQFSNGRRRVLRILAETEIPEFQVTVDLMDSVNSSVPDALSTLVALLTATAVLAF